MGNCDNLATTIDITVRPNGQTGRPGDVECDISGPRVVDDAIILPKNGTFEINFNLDPQGEASWDENDPFCARIAKCPPRNSPSHGLMKVKSVASKELVVEARATGAQNIFHYRLNFAGGGTCDPIIIRDSE